MAREIVLVRNLQCSVENLYRFLIRSPALQLCKRSCRCGEAERAVGMFHVSVRLHELRSEYYVTVLSADFNSLSLSLSLFFSKYAPSVKRVHTVVSSCVHNGVTSYVQSGYIYSVFGRITERTKRRS